MSRSIRWRIMNRVTYLDDKRSRGERGRFRERRRRVPINISRVSALLFVAGRRGVLDFGSPCRNAILMRGKIWKCRSLFPVYAPPLRNKDASRATGHSLCQLLLVAVSNHGIFFTVHRLESEEQNDRELLNYASFFNTRVFLSFLFFLFRN